MRSRKFQAPRWNNNKPKPRGKVIATKHDLDTYRGRMALFDLLVEEGSI